MYEQPKIQQNEAGAESAMSLCSSCNSAAYKSNSQETKAMQCQMPSLEQRVEAMPVQLENSRMISYRMFKAAADKKKIAEFLRTKYEIDAGNIAGMFSEQEIAELEKAAGIAFNYGNYKEHNKVRIEDVRWAQQTMYRMFFEKFGEKLDVKKTDGKDEAAKLIGILKLYLHQELELRALAYTSKDEINKVDFELMKKDGKHEEYARLCLLRGVMRSLYLRTKLTVANKNSTIDDFLKNLHVTLTRYSLEKGQYIAARASELTREAKGYEHEVQLFAVTDLSTKEARERITAGEIRIDNFTLKEEQRVEETLCIETSDHYVDQPNDIKRDILFHWCHSHGGLRTFFSDTDEKTLENLMHKLPVFTNWAVKQREDTMQLDPISYKWLVDTLYRRKRFGSKNNDEINEIKAALNDYTACGFYPTFVFNAFGELTFRLKKLIPKIIVNADGTKETIAIEDKIQFKTSYRELMSGTYHPKLKVVDDGKRLSEIEKREIDVWLLRTLTFADGTRLIDYFRGPDGGIDTKKLGWNTAINEEGRKEKERAARQIEVATKSHPETELTKIRNIGIECIRKAQQHII